MLADHYATLGLAPYAEQSAIRAAYLALMRRYHPDRNQSDDAAARVREITAAYEVLGKRDKRIDYDCARADANAMIAAQHRGNRASMRTAVGLLAIAGAAGTVALYTNPFAAEKGERARAPASIGAPAQVPQRSVEPAARCAAASSAESIKRELFARAARIRGSDGVIFGKLASHSVIRLQGANPARIDGATGTLYCNASIGIDLPPGVALPGGVRALGGEILYSLRPIGGGDALALSKAGSIARELSTLVGVPAAAKPPADAGTSVQQIEPPAPVEAPRPRLPDAAAPLPAPRIEPPRPAPPSSAAPAPRPVARTAPVRPPRVAQQTKANRKCGAPCTGPGVAGLDRTLSVLFGQSVDRADAAKKRILYRDHYSFIARLDRCSSEACARSLYLGRMREISTVMTAGAQPR